MSGDRRPPEYPVLDTEWIYRGAVVSLRRDTLQMENDHTAKREIVDHPGAVGVVAIDDDGQVVLVNQYRPALQRRLDELPAGLLDVDGEPALLAAQRELAEEAHLRARDWLVLLDLCTSPGFSNEAIRIYLARGLEQIHEQDFVAEHEERTMTVSRLPLSEAVSLVLNGEITNAAAAAGILAAEHARLANWTGLRPTDVAWPDRPGR